MDFQQIELVILASGNGRDGWSPVKPEDVPEWVKAPDNMGRLVKGETCMKCDEGEKGSLWYVALKPRDYQALVAAQQKRDRKNALRLVHANPTMH